MTTATDLELRLATKYPALRKECNFPPKGAVSHGFAGEICACDGRGWLPHLTLETCLEAIQLGDGTIQLGDGTAIVFEQREGLWCVVIAGPVIGYSGEGQTPLAALVQAFGETL